MKNDVKRQEASPEVIKSLEELKETLGAAGAPEPLVAQFLGQFGALHFCYLTAEALVGVLEAEGKLKSPEAEPEERLKATFQLCQMIFMKVQVTGGASGASQLVRPEAVLLRPGSDGSVPRR